MIINCRALVGESFEYVEEVHLEIDDGLIKGIGDGFIPDCALDARDYLVMPSLVNAHVHLGDSFAKEAVLGLGVSEAVGKGGLKWELYKEASDEVVVDGMRASVEYMMELGTTLFADFRENSREGVKLLKQALADSPIKSVILGRDIDLSECDGLGLNTYQLDQIPEDRNGRLITVHAGELEDEVGKALEHNPDIIVHFTNSTPEEIKEAARQKVSVVVCPRANAVLGAGLLDVRAIVDAGLNVALGTDNVMINQPNMFREMEFLSKTSYLNKEPLTPPEVLRIATVNGARALRKNTGLIKEGKLADLLFIDINAPNLKGSRDILASIVHRCEPANIKRVMVDGSTVLDKNKEVTVCVPASY